MDAPEVKPNQEYKYSEDKESVPTKSEKMVVTSDEVTNGQQFPAHVYQQVPLTSQINAPNNAEIPKVRFLMTGLVVAVTALIVGAIVGGALGSSLSSCQKRVSDIISR
jgi:hypothetical protein